MSVNLRPGQTYAPPLRAPLFERVRWEFAFVDEDGDALDLDGSQLALTVESGDGTGLFTVTAEASDNTVIFAVSASSHAGAGVYRYSIRNDDEDDAVLAEGLYTIVAAAAED